MILVQFVCLLLVVVVYLFVSSPYKLDFNSEAL